jgi:hypothetical protein
LYSKKTTGLCGVTQVGSAARQAWLPPTPSHPVLIVQPWRCQAASVSAATSSVNLMDTGGMQKLQGTVYFKGGFYQAGAGMTRGPSSASPPGSEMLLHCQLIVKQAEQETRENMLIRTHTPVSELQPTQPPSQAFLEPPSLTIPGTTRDAPRAEPYSPPLPPPPPHPVPALHLTPGP